MRRSLLQRQLRRHGLSADEPPSPDQWRAVLETIELTYQEAEQDRYTLERSLAISSSEMRTLYDDLKRSSESQLALERDKLRAANRFLDSIVENIPHVVFVKDARSLVYVRLNRAGEEMTGFTEASLIGKSDRDLFPADQATRIMAIDREVLAQRGVVTIERELIQTPAGPRWLTTKKIPILDADGQPMYLLGISEDITDHIHACEELISAKEAAEKATRVKSDFLMNMSHELRTPLNAILGFARVLVRNTASPDYEEFLHHILHASEHMLSLVGDLLDLRNLEEHRARRPHLAPIEIAPIIHETVGLLRSLIDAKELALTIEVPPETRCVLAERRPLVQILMNLISNAAKFTPAGGTVAISSERRGPRIHFVIRDSGIGIAEADQARLFTYFEQVGDKHRHHMQGSGVGLALTRALVEQQGGTITLHSALGEGCTFDFNLQAA